MGAVSAAMAARVGQELAVSDWLVVDQARIDAFAECTGDHQWIHVDVARAKAGPFGATIAHGFLTLSLVPGLTSGAWAEGLGLEATLNYGLDRVRFLTPVRAGSRVRNSREAGVGGGEGGGADFVVFREHDGDRGGGEAGVDRVEFGYGVWVSKQAVLF